MDKWILLTGASSGIGMVTARFLGEKGYKLVLLARSTEKLQQLSQELKNESLVVPCDLADLESIGSVFVKCKDCGIKLDGLVHCAGVGTNIPVKNNDIGVMKDIMTVNYYAFVELCKYFNLRKYSNECASVVVVSSISPLTCLPGACNYASSKGAVNAAVRVMSKEFMKRKIRVNAVLPGYVNTPLGPAEDDPVYIAQQPLGIIKAEYVSSLINYLLSDEARYITGTLIPISGGMNY